QQRRDPRNLLRIWFYLNGQRCKEPLAGVPKINKASIAYANNKRQTILAEIKEGRFDYLAHFPDSARAAALSGRAGGDSSPGKYLSARSSTRRSC
ncbi:DUF3596 domain-containing protein, partial [Pseudomonas syringae pv. actinidiae]|nr:DUF3596 domain-containing protein [Pseudomonas syringae pv. actinidiae]